MDNKAYLDQIAVKGKNATNSGPLLSPLMIKLLIAGAIMLITLIVVAVMFNNTNDKLTQSYERLYLRVTQLCGTKGPYKQYSTFINSSDLAAYANQLETSLTNTTNRLSPVWNSLNVNSADISKDVKNEETTSFNSYMHRLEEASVNGQMDSYYSSLTANRIMQLKTLEEQILKKTKNKSLPAILEQSIGELDKLYERFRDFNSTLE